MRKWRWLTVLLALPLLYVVIVMTLRVIGPSAEQKQAVALMSTAPFRIERDAFAALWLMPFDVPEAELEAVARRDIETFDAMSASKQSAPFESLAAGRYERLPMLQGDTPPACASFDRDCLTQVRANRPAAIAWIAKHRRSLSKVEALDQYDGITSGFALSMNMPFAPLGGVSSLVAINAAVQFDDGAQHQALDGVCRHALTWRRLGSHSSILLPRMLGDAYFRQSAELAADLLAEMPTGADVPESCATAFSAPQLIDVDMCAAMQGEWRFFSAGIEAAAAGETGNPKQDLVSVVHDLLFFDANATSHFHAAQLARFCDPQRGGQLLIDQAEVPPPIEWNCAWSELIHNWMGCTLSEIAAPSYDGYQNRILDQAARMRLMGGLLWWRSQTDADESAAARLARMPQEFQSATRPVELVDAERALRIRNYYGYYGDYWQVPLPSSRIP
jgi:hypothetical protein